MAELLKRENDILTLKVELLAFEHVRCTLQFHSGGPLQSQVLWEGTVSSLGIPPASERTGSGLRNRLNSASFQLPGVLLHSIEQGLHTWCSEGPGREPALWVHLVKPYGALRYLPWERLLFKALNVPVLMLPDFIFPPPRESTSDLNIALCASAPLDSEDSPMHQALWIAIQSIIQGCGKRIRLHVFIDAVMYDNLRGNLNLTDDIVLYDPRQAAPFVADDLSSRLVDRTGTLRSPWLLWMREALKNVSTDVVHFVCHGHLSGATGAMLFAQSPLTRTERYLAGPVGCTELSGFLTQIGAWSTAFSAPGDNHSPAGLRALADEIAQTLPGPMMLFDPRHGDPHELEAGYRFVHAPRPQSPPRAQGLYLYCQPYLLLNTDHDTVADDVLEHIEQHAERYARNAEQSATVRMSRPGDGAADIPRKSVSAVTAATERLAEQVQLQYQQVLRDQIIPESIARHEMNLAIQTIDRLRKTVGEIEKDRLANEMDIQLTEMERKYFEIMASKIETNASMEPANVGAAQGNDDIKQALFETVGRIKAVMDDITQLSFDSEHWDERIKDRLPKLEKLLHAYDGILSQNDNGSSGP
jgi:hypothetical protein